MKTSTRALPVLVATSFAALTLAGCSAAANAAPETNANAAEAAIQPVSQVQEKVADDETDVVDDPCAATPDNRIEFSHYANDRPIYASLRHDLIDLGESDYAQGAVALDDAGEISSYTVAPGDSPMAIGDRFCVDWITVLQYNNTWPTIDPGEVLTLRPDPTVEWIDAAQVLRDNAG